MEIGRIKTLYETPDKGFGHTLIFQDTLYRDSVVIVRTDSQGRETSLLVSTKAIMAVAKQLEPTTKGKEFSVWNRITKDLQYVVALSAQEACEKLGYMIGDCQVKEVV